MTSDGQPPLTDTTTPTATGPLTVRTIDSRTHLDFLDSQPEASFLQTPAWGEVKKEWKPESIGWYDASGTLVGAGLVLHRQLPKVKRYLSYLPEGPVIDWEGDLAAWLPPMAAHLKSRGAFAVRMGPPVVTRRWTAQQIKAGIADEDVRTLGQVAPEDRSATGAAVVAQLNELGWQPLATEGGFAAGQPQYNFVIPLAGRTEADVLAGMNQLWRRNIKKADKAGCLVTQGTRADLEAFHELYRHTAERDGFTPRPLSYFTTMHDALVAEHPDRFQLWLAHHEGDLVAATIGIRVGTHYWYSYGASSTEKREVRGSNAIQWAMIRHALASGCAVYDLRGITDTLDSDDPHVGLIQFKVGTGGEAIEYAGEWDLPISKLLHRGFELYLRRRS
ncbi:lipid II:glycine glycyltransferase FemX [Nocardioides rotundus]|uniref:lipid II:glycine glycyltransferase FemX n=1 Tax=Nocardioides rotundus TaxID=1774216 RepID=UPI002958B855|nr:peptidoglycan bridge formation glycyltransferase FemA/FemB family protein [Nocardioides rotundus]